MWQETHPRRIYDIGSTKRARSPRGYGTPRHRHQHVIGGMQWWADPGLSEWETVPDTSLAARRGIRADTSRAAFRRRRANAIGS
jgi:hypothetical protein